MNLFVSIATSGLPKSSGNMPWICRIAAALCDDSGAVLDHYACNIRAEDGARIEEGATRKHGITTAMCTRGGVAERLALGVVLGFRAQGTKRPVDLPGLASCATAVVCWDAEFCREVLNARYARHGEPHGSWVRPGLAFHSLQPLCTPWCKLPPAQGDDGGGYRRPTRDEAAAALLGLQARPLPHGVDSHLSVEQALYAALRARKAFETEAAA